MTAECEGQGGGNRLTWQKQQNPFSISTLEPRLIFHPLHEQGEGEEGSSPLHSPRLRELLHTILSISFREKSQTLALDTVHSSHLCCITPISQGNSWWWGHQGEQGQPEGADSSSSAPPGSAPVCRCQLSSPAPRVVAAWWQVKQFPCTHCLESVLASSSEGLL